MIRKIKFIESYVFLNQLNMLCEQLNSTPFKEDLLFKTIQNLNLNLLQTSKKMLLKLKINDLSLSVLKSDISKTKFFKNSIDNYKLLCKMMQDFIKHFNLISYYANRI